VSFPPKMAPGCARRRRRARRVSGGRRTAVRLPSSPFTRRGCSAPKLIGGSSLEQSVASTLLKARSAPFHFSLLRVLRCYGGVGDGGRRHVQRRGPSATTGRWRSARWRECPSAFAFGLRCPPLRSCGWRQRAEERHSRCGGGSTADSAKTLPNGTAAVVRCSRGFPAI